MPASKLVSQLPVPGHRMPTSAVVGALCGGIVHRVRGSVDKLHGGAGYNVRRRGVCYRVAMIAQEWRQVHGFQSQAMHELAIRLHGKWTFAGSSPQCLAAALNEPVAQRHTWR
jgi:hypothetical protein